MAALILSLKIKKIAKSDEINCEFYLQEKNVTPVEPTDIGCPATRSEEGPDKTRLVSELYTDDWNGYDGEFPDVDEKFTDYLFDGLIARDKKDASESKYDVGSGHRAGEDVTTREYEVELTESPTLPVFNVPSRVTVKG